MSDKLYYMNQTGWQTNEYYALHRYLHRLFSHYEKKMDEIRNMNVELMSEKTRVLIYCIIKYYNLDILLNSNLSSLMDCKPLEEPLVLGNHNIHENSVYERMNVML